MLEKWHNKNCKVRTNDVYGNGSDQKQLNILLLEGDIRYTKIYSGLEFNTHPRLWEPGCFLMHLMGMKTKERVEIMKSFNSELIEN